MIKINTIACFPFQGKDSGANYKNLSIYARMVRYIFEYKNTHHERGRNSTLNCVSFER